MTEEERDAKALNDVNTYGCHVLKVLAGDSLPQFAYSIGIEKTSRQPDLLVTGLKLEVGHWIINEYNRRVREGETFVPNQPYEGFLDGFPVFFSPMLKDHYAEHVGWGLWLHNDDNFRVFQLIWPDTSGLWPWDPNATAYYRRAMPLLCEPLGISENPAALSVKPVEAMPMDHALDNKCHTMCICCEHVFDGDRPILYICRDFDGDDDVPQYLCGQVDHFSADGGRILHFSHLKENDPSILDPWLVPKGAAFERSSISDAWSETDIDA
ncbi:DUF4262 domain-containing protein [Paracoccus sp. IB05]|uniref:DUF4262 domain-containing protein n=1 Tax=Paracoccus sp. IB05 TaxID=2779367 RepID=UPI0018E70BFC|nr:DUF4262 domain-containing protein [Paracoccus sp. IB05]MBJ2154101.1 DUF4262 domain-containing protein [Paracoccus sp. IB05]